MVAMIRRRLFLFLPEDRPQPKAEALPKSGFRDAGLRLRRFHVISVVDAHAQDNFTPTGVLQENPCTSA